MTVVNLGVNSESINYEVALEVLGESRQPFMTALREEKTKPKPSAQFIKYCEMRLAAIDEIHDELLLEDTDTIARILDIDHARNLFRIQTPE